MALRRIFCLLLFWLACPSAGLSFDLDVGDPVEALGAGPLVYFDASHANLHRITPSEAQPVPIYGAFASVLRNDGYVVVESTSLFSTPAFVRELGHPECLGNLRASYGVIGEPLIGPVQTLVIVTPTLAISWPEARIVRDWVRCGGSLLLIMDHSPYAAPAQEILNAFGLWIPGDLEEASAQRAPVFFHAALYSRADGSLDATHPIVLGRNASERIDHVGTMHGSGILIQGESIQARPFRQVDPILRALPGSRYSTSLTSPPIDPSPQQLLAGVALRYGRGRAYVLAEARMNTTIPNSTGAGMDASFADENKQHVLNSMHWLGGRLCAGEDDDDQDGVCNGRDNCVFVANTAQRDGDVDGFGDACDDGANAPADSDLVCAGQTGCTLPVCSGGPDQDDDGVCDADDTCLWASNPFQEDSDRDGYGDACEALGGSPGASGLVCAGTIPCVAPVCGSAADADGDGICDSRDSCSEVFDPFPWDINADGYGDRCDPDVDDDGVVGSADWIELRKAMNSSFGDPSYRAILDFNGDGTIDHADFLILASMYGSPPGPSGIDCAGASSCP